MRTERFGERAAFLGLKYEQARVAEFVAAIPKRNLCADLRAHVIERLRFLASIAEREQRHSMVMCNCVDILARFVDLAMDHKLAIASDAFRPRVDGLGVERVF